MQSSVILEVYQAAKNRARQGAADTRDQVIIGVWEAALAANARATHLQQQLDAANAGNAQSAEALANMTMRLAGLPSGMRVC